MGDVSEHFSRIEFKCRCGECDFDAVDIELVSNLEDCRAYFSRPLIILSACRCPIHNAKVNGSLKSQHLRGKAADIVVQGIPPDAVADFFEKMFPESGGVGRYDTFTHRDVRAAKARWDFRGQTSHSE